MTYKALYRKYRPDNFDSVVGQDTIIKTLQNTVKENKISHAYLFNGPRGTGKTSVAKIFAKTVNCLDSKNGMPCGVCDICKLIKEDQTADIIEIDAASNNGVDEIRDLKSKINLAPTVGKYKVYIIDEVHMLSIGAFNALLKTLEEPPRHVIFILATTEMHKLPLTIISRCQNFNFKKVTEEQIVERLDYISKQESINIEPSAIYAIAKIADGGMRDAIGLLEQLFSFTANNIKLNDVELLSASVSRNVLAEIIENIVKGDISGIFDKINSFYKDGKDFIRISEDLLIFLKDILLYKKAEKYFEENSTYEINVYQKLIEELTVDNIFCYINEINKMITDLKISSHPKIIFEINMLKLTNNLHKSLSEPKNEVKNELSKIIKVDIKEDKKTKIDNDVDVEDKDKEYIQDYNKIEKNDVEDFLPFVNIALYKKIIINNTLASAEKEILTNLNNKCSQLQTFLINKDYKQTATIMLDGKIVGASNRYIIYTYPYDIMVEKADEYIEEIEKLISNITGGKFNVVNITSDNWALIRPYYIKLMKDKKTIEVLPEVDKIVKKNKQRNKEIEVAINMFGEELIEIK